MEYLLNYVFLVLSFTSYLKPAGFDVTGMDEINRFFNVLRIICAGLICFQYIIKRKKVSRLVVSECVFFVIYVFLLMIHNSDIKYIAILGMSVITMTMLVEYCIDNGQTRKLINTLFFIYFSLIAFNLYFIIKVEGLGIENHNDLIEKSSFLSTANGSAGYFFPALLIASIYAAYRGRKYTILSVCLMLSIGLSVVLFWSATSIVGVFLFGLSYIIGKRNIYVKKYNVKWTVFGAAIINIAISFFKVQYLFSTIITKLLHKSITLTGRTKFWDIGINGFLNSPLIGNGKEVIVIDNVLIRILYQGGIILLGCFVVMVFIALKGVIIKKEETWINYLFCSIFSIITIMSITEGWYTFFGFYIILVLLSNANKIEADVFSFKDKQKKKIKLILRR